ncbi:ATP-binding cassette domain-containing protein [Enterococcus sp. 669A]|uniref:ATP-binding cassette domain-containing protein n=1 Tax=Candidatus Enterococcus moelleringii TaxID=2815325 RepID=A0ABS3L743_9ENTE|nr:ATP-binding cassette domain-containing protein [Enterococcus sp. 669A]MBO1305439.1 ATP-binding cassette domain-containing protein [Enterococcus sp. 669A]
MSLLELKNICYQPQQQLIIDHINLDVKESDFLTISGPSGGGKSTLLRLIASLATPTSGDIIFNGKKQNEYLYTEYRQLVSYCFQQPTLFGDTVRDNLDFPYLIREKNPDQQTMLQHLEMVDLPQDYLDKPITQLSGGERQRVALIRNILFLPKILLLDEVTVGLDEQNKAIIQQLIAHIHQKQVTILQVTHDEAEIQAAEKIIWIKGGKLDHEPIRQ